MQYECVDSSLKADREFCLAAVLRHGSALEYVHPSLMADRDICLAAVQQSGYALTIRRLLPEGRS